MAGRRCRGCGAPVRWVTTEKGRRMPLDPEPVEVDAINAARGLFVIRPGLLGEGERVIAVTPGFVEESREPVYISHFATCPEAKTFRRRKS